MDCCIDPSIKLSQLDSNRLFISGNKIKGFNDSKRQKDNKHEVADKNTIE